MQERSAQQEFLLICETALGDSESEPVYLPCSFNSTRLPATAVFENRMSFRSKTSEGINNVSIHLKGQDLIFKPKIESSNHINHLCFPLLVCLTSHTWIADGLAPPVIKPRQLYRPQ